VETQGFQLLEPLAVSIKSEMTRSWLLGAVNKFLEAIPVAYTKGFTWLNTVDPMPAFAFGYPCTRKVKEKIRTAILNRFL